MLYILFGLPGAGKTFVGKLFEQWGFYFYDGDADLPEDMKIALAAERTITDELRDRFFKRLINTTKALYIQHKKLVVAQTFIKEKYRQQLLAELPNAIFILVQAENSVRKHRLSQRNDYPLAYLMNMETYFDKPRIAHSVIDNNKTGEKSVRKQIERVLQKI